MTENKSTTNGARKYIFNIKKMDWTLMFLDQVFYKQRVCFVRMKQKSAKRWLKFILIFWTETEEFYSSFYLYQLKI